MTPMGLLELMQQFVNDQIDAPEFVKQYQALWRQLRDSGAGSNVPPDIIDRAFTAADCYSESPQTGWEISATQLRDEIASLLSNLNTKS